MNLALWWILSLRPDPLAAQSSAYIRAAYLCYDVILQLL
jgi:hypothetical protein